MWRLLAPVLVVMALGACGAGTGVGANDGEGEVSSPQLDRMREAVDGLAPTYIFDVTSTCGERNLLGSFRVTVVDDQVAEVRPLDGTRLHGLGPDDFPTLADLLDLVDEVGPEADLEVELDEGGLPRQIVIDHVPEAIDDEECYRISNLA
ncbi:MAG: DUF6174 domain-containing protein [Nocardioides sp.]